MRVLLDTNAYTDFRGKGEWKEVLGGATEVLMPTVVVGELKYGFILGNREGRNLRNLREFLAVPRVSLITPGEATTTCYAQFHAYLRKNGNPIPTNDIWIAALTYEYEAILCTRDRHFDHLPQIEVQYS